MVLLFAIGWLIAVACILVFMAGAGRSPDSWWQP